jgi:hypothetical protein
VTSTINEGFGRLNFQVWRVARQQRYKAPNFNELQAVSRISVEQ